jgi:hypothetical protein
MLLGEPGVHQREAQPGAGGGADREQQAPVVAGEHPDDRAFRQTELAQGMGEGVGLLVELPVGEGAAFVGDGGGVRVFGRGLHDQGGLRAEPGVVHRGPQQPVGAPQIDDPDLVHATDGAQAFERVSDHHRLPNSLA